MYGPWLDAGRHVVVRRQVQARGGELAVVSIPKDVNPGGDVIMIGRERGGKLRALELVALGHRVGADEPMLVHVDAEDEFLAGVEPDQADREGRAAVDQRDRNRVDAGPVDDR
jgi:hypothetical protein